MGTAPLLRVFAQAQEQEHLRPLGRCIQACPKSAVKQNSELFSGVPGHRVEGPALSWFLCPIVPPETTISSVHEEKAPEVAGLFLACLVFPLALHECGHCLREENAHPARPENSTLLPSGVQMLDCIDLLRGD